jgi:hypothetical protein
MIFAYFCILLHIFAYLSHHILLKRIKRRQDAKTTHREELSKFGLDATAFLGAITSGEEVPN